MFKLNFVITNIEGGLGQGGSEAYFTEQNQQNIQELRHGCRRIFGTNGVAKIMNFHFSKKNSDFIISLFRCFYSVKKIRIILEATDNITNFGNFDLFRHV